MSKTNTSKQCPKCKSIKLLFYFYKNASAKDGLQANCKDCNRAYAKTDAARCAQTKYRKTEGNKLAQAKYQVEYRKSDKGRLARSKSKAKYAKTDAGKASHAKNQAKYESANPVKRKAQNIINYAIESGKIARPHVCSECPGTQKIEGHHDNYALPLIVRWLCQLCHNAWHKENGRGLNG